MKRYADSDREVERLNGLVDTTAETGTRRELPAPGAVVYRSPINALLLFVELALVVFSSWTLAFQICLYTRVPAVVTYAVFLVFLVAGLLLISPRIWTTIRTARWMSSLTICTLCMSAGLAATTLILNRPHFEDAVNFHRVLVQVEQMHEPLIMRHTLLNTPDLAMSSMFALVSYEMGIAFLAAALGGDPLWFCQHVGQLVAAFLLPIVYVLLFHRIGVRGLAAVAATLLVVAFLMLDGNRGMSFGHWASTHLRVGKAVLFTVLVPLTAFYSLRYLSRPTGQRLARVALCGVCGVGLSNSSLFMLPVLLFAVSTSYFVTFGCRTRRATRAVVLNLGGAYCIFIGCLIATGIISAPADTTIWDRYSNRIEWNNNLFLILENRYTLARNVVILLLPLVALRLPWRRYLVTYSIIAAAVFANPITGPLLVKLLTPGAYHRLVLLLPVPLCFGLLTKCVPKTRAEWNSLAVLLPLVPVFGQALLAFGRMIVAWLWQLLSRVISNASIKTLFEGLDFASLRPELRRILASGSRLSTISSSLVWRLALGCVVTGAVWISFSKSVLAVAHLKHPSAYSLPATEHELCADFSSSIAESGNVLAPRYLHRVLALLRSDIRFEADTFARTLHMFRNANRREEGQLRVQAAALLEEQEERVSLSVMLREASPAIDAALQHGVEYVIVHTRQLRRLEWEFDQREVEYEELTRQGRWVLLHIQRPPQ